MVKQTDASELDVVFGALSDPTRRKIVETLVAGPVRVTDLAAPFEMSLPAVSKHVRVLERAGIVVREQQGRVHNLRLDARPMKQVSQWVEDYRRFWEDSFDALAKFLDDTKPESEKKGSKEKS